MSYHRLDEQLALLGKVLLLSLFITSFVRRNCVLCSSLYIIGGPSQVLNAGDDAVGLEQLEEDADDITVQKAKRIEGSMSDMSGATGRVYMEYAKYVYLVTELL